MESLDIVGPKRILDKIDFQRDALGITRNDISLITGIPYSTLINNFQKNKIPKFNELYKISLILGITIDDLLSTDETEHISKNNILYWAQYHPRKNFSNTFLKKIPDKIAIARTFKTLSELSEPEAALSYEDLSNKKINQLKFFCFYHSITMNEVDDLFIFQKESERINNFFSNANDKDLTLHDYIIGQNQLLCSLWSYQYIAVQNLWRHIDSIVPKKFKNLSAFLKETKLNSQTYARYLHAAHEKSTPGTDTVMRACTLLNIEDIDSAIRSYLPQVPNDGYNPLMPLGIKPHDIENNNLKDNLKSLPYLAMFYDCLFALGFDDLKAIALQIQSSINCGYDNADTIKGFSEFDSINASFSNDESYVPSIKLKNAVEKTENSGR